MHNPLFYEWQRMRASTFNIPRFLHSYDETLDGGLILPRGMLPTVTVTDLAAQAGSRLDIIDERTPGTAQQFTLTATLKPPQRAAATELARSRPACTPGKGSTALRWTPYFLAAPERDGSSSTPAASSALTTARPPPRSTTTTTSSLASSPHPWPSAHPATPASASPTRLPRPATAPT